METSSRLSSGDAGPVRLIEIVASEVSTPRNDGTAGSALYRVPIRLSRRPSAAWCRLFVQVWDRPPSFSMMHRPGIASVIGDRIVLDGTTVDEIEKYHRATLKAVVDRVNQMVGGNDND